jgi:MscS family membrane protein
MIDQFLDMISTFETEILVTLLSGFILSAVSYVLSPLILHRVFDYMSTDEIDFDQGRFVNNARITISITFLITVFILILRDSSLFLSVDDLIDSTLVTIIFLLWIRIIHSLGIYSIEKIVKIRYDKSITPIIENVWTLGVIVSVIFISFDIWNIDVTPLLASAGIAGVVFGLAARDTISNFFGSIALYADNTYETGDYITMGKDEEVAGYVRDISIRSTQLVTLAGNKIVIPNSKLHKSVIENRSAPEDQYRIILKVGISYDEDPEYAEMTIRKALEDVIESEESYRSSWFFGGTDSYKIFLSEFADSEVTFKIFVKVNNPEDEPRIKSRFYHKIYQELEEADIEIPFPQRSVHFDEDVDGGFERKSDSTEQKDQQP